MRLEEILLGLIVVCVVIVSGTGIWYSTADHYGQTHSDERWDAVYSHTATLTNETYTISESMRSKTLEGEIDDGETSWDSMIRGAYSAGRLIKNAFPLTVEVVRALAAVVGVPPFIISAIIAAIAVMFVFGIIMLVLRITT